MTMQARYAGRCKMCGGSIAVGETIDYSREAGARHVVCARSGGHTKPLAARAPKSAPRRSAEPPRVDGERTATRRSRGRGDGMCAGEVVHMTHATMAGGGGPDGHYWTAIADSSRYRDDDSDEWMLSTRMRPATDAEAAPIVERAHAEQRAGALRKLPHWIAEQVRRAAHLTEERAPADAWQIDLRPDARLGSEVLRWSGDALWVSQSSYDDGPYTWRMPVSAEQIEMVAAMIAAVN